MKLPFQLLIGLRYVRSRRQIGQDNRFISFISGLSMVGIALGVAALIVVLSVMNGFQKELRSRILGVTSHIEVVGMDGALQNWHGGDGNTGRGSGIQGFRGVHAGHVGGCW